MTTESPLPEIVGVAIEAAVIAVGGDIVAPAAGLVGSAVARYLQGRLKRAGTILRSQLERAGVTAEDFRDAEQFAAAVVRYHRAARDQAADENLRILAQAMVGLARRHELWASDFLKYAEILASLSRDELVLIGALMAEHQRFYASPRPDNSGPTLWLALVGQLAQSPPFKSPFPSTAYVAAVAARAMRSGLLSPIAGFDGTTYELSPIGIEVRQFVDIEAALRGEGPHATGEDAATTEAGEARPSHEPRNAVGEEQ